MKKIILTLLAATTGFAAYSQSYLGLHSSNYDAIAGLRYNPSLLTANNMQWQVTILGFDAFAGNNYLSLSGRIKDWSQDFERYESVKETINGDDKNLNINMDIQGPSFSFRIKDKNAIAITTRARALGTIKDISEPLAISLWRNDLALLDWESQFTNSRATVGLNIYGEMGLSYSRAILDKEGHSLHVGVSGKVLFNGVTGYLKAEDMTFTHDTIAKTVSLNESKIDAIFSWPFDDEEKYKFGIGGFGIDAGVVYEYKKPGKTDYFIRAGASLIDAGFIKYEASKNSRVFRGDGRVVNESDIYDEVSDEYIELDDVLDVMGIKTIPTGKYKASLPMAIHVFGDIKVVPKFFVNISGQINVNSDKKEHPSAQVASKITLTPRFELKAFALFAPITYDKFAGFDFGLGLRAGQFSIGTANLLGSLIRKDTKAFDMFMSIGFGKARKTEAPKTWSDPNTDS
jgi:hypothetical protein